MTSAAGLRFGRGLALRRPGLILPLQAPARLALGKTAALAAKGAFQLFRLLRQKNHARVEILVGFGGGENAGKLVDHILIERQRRFDDFRRTGQDGAVLLAPDFDRMALACRQAFRQLKAEGVPAGADPRREQIAPQPVGETTPHHRAIRQDEETDRRVGPIGIPGPTVDAGSGDKVDAAAKRHDPFFGSPRSGRRIFRGARAQEQAVPENRAVGRTPQFDVMRT